MNVISSVVTPNDEMLMIYKSFAGDKERCDEIQLIRHAWCVAVQRRSLMLQQPQNDFKVIAMKTEAQVEKVKRETEEQTKPEFQHLQEELDALRYSNDINIQPMAT